MKRNFIAMILMTIVALTGFPITAGATVDSVWSGRFAIIVNDEVHNRNALSCSASLR